MISLSECCYINEANYQALCCDFSDAYLSGADWYVGPSLYDWYNTSYVVFSNEKMKTLSKVLDALDNQNLLITY